MSLALMSPQAGGYSQVGYTFNSYTCAGSEV